MLACFMQTGSNKIMERKNINRGFKKLRVWNDAIELYVNTCKVLADFPFELKKTAANCIDSAHIISRNIAEGYSRKSIRDYLRFLHIALGSCGEFHSSIYAFLQANQIKQEDFDFLDELHYKTENQLIQLIKSLQIKMKEGNWDENF
jgi:four helix bundle protein